MGGFEIGAREERRAGCRAGRTRSGDECPGAWGRSAARSRGPGRLTGTAAAGASAARGPKGSVALEEPLEDAEAVLDLVRFEARERGRQFGDGDGRASAADTHRLGPIPGSTVQVDLLRKETEIRADAKCGVVNGELADSANQIADFLNDSMQFVE